MMPQALESTRPYSPDASSTWKLFLGLSRTPHGVLDVATPAMAAMLCLGYFPPLSVIVVGLITAFAGYTAVYALNDLVDYRVDQERLAHADSSGELFHVDEIMVRHPMAQGLLSYAKGLVWFTFWAAVALVGAWWLNPWCALLFVGSAVLEVVYCKLLKITHLKVLPSALVKAGGGLAGTLAVSPSPSLGFVAVLLLWLAAWEIGGQNIANDIVDMEDDQRVAARTTATITGLRESVFRLLAAVSMAVLGGVVIYWFAGAGVRWFYPVGAAILGWLLLLAPARRLYYEPGSKPAADLFNRASYMPVSFLVLTLISIYFPI